MGKKGATLAIIMVKSLGMHRLTHFWLMAMFKITIWPIKMLLILSSLLFVLPLCQENK